MEFTYANQETEFACAGKEPAFERFFLECTRVQPHRATVTLEDDLIRFDFWGGSIYADKNFNRVVDRR